MEGAGAALGNVVAADAVEFGQASTGNGSALMELQKLYWDAYESTFGRMLEGPSLGITREINEDILKGFDAWLDYRRASFEYQVSLGDTWSQAFEQFMRRLVTLAEKGETVPSVKTLLLLWIENCGSGLHGRVSLARVHSDTGAFGQYGDSLQLREREIVDAFLKASHLASRSELDEAYRRIYELRKDVKDLKKAFQALKGESSMQDKHKSDGGVPSDLTEVTT